MKIIVFTDLDGTLLDHDSYSFEAAGPALSELRRLAIPLVLATSKTAAEVAPLHAALQLRATPAIVENGAGLFEPGAADDTDTSQYDHLRAVLRDLPPDMASRFRGFGDMDAPEIARVTGLAEDAAALARQRCFSEPGIWTGTGADLERFIEALADRGISARRGGRFLTLSHGRTKACAMRDLIRRFGADVAIALGDAPNDAEMLEAADIGVIVRNDHAPPMPPLATEPEGRIRHTSEPGPQGWNTAILRLLEEFRGT